MATTQPNLFSADAYGNAIVPKPALPHPEGATYNAELDKERLDSLYERVFNLMQDQQWRTLAEIVAVVGGSEGGVGARLRDSRKAEWGGHTVNHRRRGDGKLGVFEYQLIVKG